MAEILNLDSLFKRIDLEGFSQFVPDENAALEVLATEKWRKGFLCHHCGHTNYCRGKTPFSRRCTRCKREESATAHTLFHHCKIPVNDALKIAYLVCHSPLISSYEISRQMDIRQMTCWKFKRKIQECLEEKGKLSFTD